MQIGKSTDGLVGDRKNRKPRYYVVIWTDSKYIAVAKVYTTDPKKQKDAIKLEKKLRKKITNFNKNSAVDKRLYTKKKDGSLIKTSDLNYTAAKNFKFDSYQAGSIYKFILEDPNNRNELDALIKRISSLKK